MQHPTSSAPSPSYAWSAISSSQSNVCVCVQGFDEFMNLVMDDAEEVYVKENKRRQVGE